MLKTIVHTVDNDDGDDECASNVSNVRQTCRMCVKRVWSQRRHIINRFHSFLKLTKIHENSWKYEKIMESEKLRNFLLTIVGAYKLTTGIYIDKILVDLILVNLSKIAAKQMTINCHC